MFEDHQYKQFPENLLLSKIFRLVLARFWNLKSSARLAGQKARLGSARQKTGSDTSLLLTQNQPTQGHKLVDSKKWATKTQHINMK